jgi:hypothetical protein
MSQQSLRLDVDPESEPWSSFAEPRWVPEHGTRGGDRYQRLSEFSLNELQGIESDLFQLDELKRNGSHSDRLAWYRPFHSDRSGWGIYIREYGIHLYYRQLEDTLRREYGIRGVSVTAASKNGSVWTVPNETLKRHLQKLAFQRLLTHEWFHFQVEYLLFHLECVSNAQLFNEYRENVYTETFPPVQCIEESLANASVARSRRCARLLSEAVDGIDNMIPTLDWPGLLEQSIHAPPAYEAFGRYLGDEEFKHGCVELATHVRTGDISESRRRMQNATGVLLGGELPFSYADSVDSPSGSVPIRVLPLDRDLHQDATCK